MVGGGGRKTFKKFTKNEKKKIFLFKLKKKNENYKKKCENYKKWKKNKKVKD